MAKSLHPIGVELYHRCLRCRVTRSEWRSRKLFDTCAQEAENG